MTFLVFAATAYLVLAGALVLATDKVVELLFSETRPHASLGHSGLDRLLAVSRQIYRR
jgi:hypothetical protein